MDIGKLFSRHSAYRPNHLAVVFEDHRLTWRQYNHHINRLANALVGLGIGKGDKVATILPNCLELLVTYWACAKIGAVVVPFSTLLRAGAMKTLLQNSDTVMVVTCAGFVEEINSIKAELPAIGPERYLLTDRDGVPGFLYYHELTAATDDHEPQGIAIGDDDPFNIMYSSGTTGMPKGIVHTHYIRAMYGTIFASSFRMTPECVTMHAGAIVFNGAFVDLMPTVFLGGTYILLPQFDPVSYIDTIEKERVTHIILVPAQIVAMLNAPNFSYDALKSLQMIQTLGAPLLMEHKKTLTDALPNRFYELYGLTEGFMTVLDPFDYPAKPESVGVPPPFLEMKIVDEERVEVPAGQVGEICGRGPHLMPGYYKRDDLTQQSVEDGWLYTGDMGYVDEDGFLYLVDRKKDLIISGGVNVYPRDIEEVVARHEDVREVAVFGAPHDKWGETPVAAVILNPMAETDANTLREWINQRVDAKFQRVSDVWIMNEFPRNVAGKTLKREMRDRYGQSAE